MSDLVGNPEDLFSDFAAHIVFWVLSIKHPEKIINFSNNCDIFSSPVQSTGRAIVLTLASALTLALPLALPFPSHHF